MLWRLRSRALAISPRTAGSVNRRACSSRSGSFSKPRSVRITSDFGGEKLGFPSETGAGSSCRPTSVPATVPPGFSTATAAPASSVARSSRALTESICKPPPSSPAGRYPGGSTTRTGPYTFSDASTSATWSVRTGIAIRVGSPAVTAKLRRKSAMPLEKITIWLRLMGASVPQRLVPREKTVSRGGIGVARRGSRAIVGHGGRFRQRAAVAEPAPGGRSHRGAARPAVRTRRPWGTILNRAGGLPARSKNLGSGRGDFCCGYRKNR